MARKILFVFLLSLATSSILARGIGRVDDEADEDGRDVASNFLQTIKDNGAEVREKPRENRPKEQRK